MAVYYYFLLFTLCYSTELFEEYYKEAEEKMNKMTMEERIGQLFFPRFNLTNSTDDIKNKKPGGFMLFANDFVEFDEKYIQDYIKKIQNLSEEVIGLPLGLAVNEEGGEVNTVSLEHRKEGPFPSPREIYNKSGIKGILEIEQEKRELLRKFNLNINLAPVADFSYNPKDYIYNRTIGRLPEEAAENISIEVEGYDIDSFSCCLKYFPSYGNNSDTHSEISIDNRTYENFQREDFKIFQAAIDKKAPIVLVSNNIVTCKDENYPASISKAWHDVLRNELNFSGLIMTDDLSLEAIRKDNYNENEAVLAIKAGNDIILTSDYYTHFDAVIKAYEDGKIDKNLIDTACKRILAWKFKYLYNHDKDNTVLIIIASVLGVIILGGLIAFLVMWLKNRSKSDPKTEELNSGPLDKHTI